MTYARRKTSAPRPARRFTPLVGEQLEQRVPLAIADSDFVQFPFVGGPVTAVGNIGYFACGYSPWGAPSSDLCRTDGTLTGTSLVSGSEGAFPRDFVNVNGLLFFAAQSSQLWKTDGSTGGAQLVKDIEVNTGSPLANVNGTLFFSASDGIHGFELWKSNGTPEGTAGVKDISPGPGQSFPFQFVNVAGTLYFTANDGTHGFELWKSDGTLTGTRMVKDIAPGPAHASAGYLTNLNGTLVFRANDGVHGYQLWKSDGTESGTVIVKGGFFNGGNNNAGPRSPYNLNGTLFFNANDGVSGYELWKSDGTAAGTTLVKDIIPGAEASNPFAFVQVGSSLFFYALDGQDCGLWKTDGTPAGTSFIAPLTPQNGTRFPRPGIGVLGEYFFPFNDGVYGYELWKSDGTSAGTILVKDFRPGPDGSYPQNLSTTGGTLFFDITSDGSNNEMWSLYVGPAPQTPLVVVPPAIRRNADALEISGTQQNDRLTVRLSHGKIIVDGFLGQQPVHLSFSQNAINRIVVNLDDGDDWLKISRDIGARALINAGAGNDVVTAGRGSAVIAGGDGDDILSGSTCRDVLIGGAGRDKLYGGGGSDYLIASATIYDDDPHALLAIRMEWASIRSQAGRIRNLKNGSGPILQPLGVKLVGALLPDSDVDALFGGSDADYFLYDQKSEMKDLQTTSQAGFATQLIRRWANPVLGVI